MKCRLPSVAMSNLFLLSIATEVKVDDAVDVRELIYAIEGKEVEIEAIVFGTICEDESTYDSEKFVHLIQLYGE